MNLVNIFNEIISDKLTLSLTLSTIGFALLIFRMKDYRERIFCIIISAISLLWLIYELNQS